MKLLDALRAYRSRSRRRRRAAVTARRSRSSIAASGSAATSGRAQPAELVQPDNAPAGTGPPPSPAPADQDGSTIGDLFAVDSERREEVARPPAEGAEPAAAPSQPPTLPAVLAIPLPAEALAAFTGAASGSERPLTIDHQRTEHEPPANGSPAVSPEALAAPSPAEIDADRQSRDGTGGPDIDSSLSGIAFARADIEGVSDVDGCNSGVIAAPAPARSARIRHAVLDLSVMAVLLALTLALYRNLLPRQQVAADPYLLGVVYPYREFLAQALRHGDIPLWNPFSFTGVPFLADPRAGALYPPNLTLLWFDPPRAVAFSVVGHIGVAAVAMYLLARLALGQQRPGAFVAACIFALGGVFTANAVEPNVVEAGVWLPVAIGGLELALRRRVALGVSLMAVALALSVLAGQPHTTVLVTAAVVLWAIARIAAQVARAQSFWRGASAVVASVVLLAAGATLAAGLAAAQLLPAWELWRQSPRAETWSYQDSERGSLPPARLARAVFPGISRPTERTHIVLLGFTGLALIAVGLRTRRFEILVGALLAAIGLAEALGAATILHRALSAPAGGVLPFDHPTRGLLLTAFGGALLAGAGVERLSVRTTGRSRPRDRLLLLVPPLVLLLPVLLVLPQLSPIELPADDALHAVWLGLAVVAVDIALVMPLLRPRAWVALLMCAAIPLELVIGSSGLPVFSVADSSVWQTPSRLAGLATGADVRPRLAGGETAPVEAATAAWGSVDRAGRDALAPDTHLVEGIARTDGMATALLPPVRLLEVTGAGQRPDNGDAAVRSTGTTSNVSARVSATHVLLPPVSETRIGGVDFDVSDGPFLAKDQEWYLPVRARVVAGELVLLVIPPADTALFTSVVDVTVSDAAGNERKRPLVMGVDLTTPVTDPAIVRQFGGRVYAARVDLGRPLYAANLWLKNASGRPGLRIPAATLVDDRSGLSVAVPVTAGLVLEPALDPPVARDYSALPRVALVRSVSVEADTAATRRALVTRPLDQVAVDRRPQWSAPESAPVAADRLTISEDQPEQMSLVVAAVAPAVLVVRDGWDAGWQATIDGQLTPVLMADGLFRAVAVPAGEHVVRFRYAPASWEVGRWISLATLALIGVALTIWIVIDRTKRRVTRQYR